MRVLFVQTGGTIDKDYSKPSKAYNFEFGDAAVKRILERVNANLSYRVVTALKKDSLDITDADRRHLKRVIEHERNERVVVTHGSDTMLKSARVLSAINGKTIVLTGSRYPERFKDTDAWFNVGAALMAAELMPHGVYIAMNGRVHEWKKTRKNLKTGKFETI